MSDITMNRDAPIPSGQRGRSDGSDLDEQLAALSQQSHNGLRAEWSRLYRAHPPKRICRGLLELGVAWKLQERALGGLGSPTRRLLASLTEAMESGADLVKQRAVKPKSGTRLIREWQGESHDVLVLDNGFRWRGRHWDSPSAIAREITGARWSGPRFFGLHARREKTEGSCRGITAIPATVGARDGALGETSDA